MALLCAAMMAAASLGVAAPAQAAFRFDRTDVSLSAGTNQRLSDVAVGDLDGANGPDIVVSARGDNMVYVVLNQGGGSFAGPVGYSACAPLTGAPGQIVTGQLNVAQDQQLDVAVACGVLTVLRGNGAGGLGAPLPTALASGGSLAAGELTGGGGPELLTGAPTANAAADLLCFVVQPFELADIRCGNPAPVQDPPLFASTMQGPLAGTQTPIAANFSDPLGLRYDEVVGVNPLNTREVNVYGREPASNFTAWSSTMRATSADRAYFLDVGDVEGDGDRDLLVGHLQGGVLDVFVWGGSGILPGAVPRTTQTIGSATTDGKLADFDGDGALDVVVAGLEGRLAVHRGRGDGTFAPRQDVGGAGRGGRDTGRHRPLWRPKAGHRPRHLQGLGGPVRPGDGLDQRDGHRATRGHAGPPAGQGHHRAQDEIPCESPSEGPAAREGDEPVSRRDQTDAHRQASRA